MNIIKQFEVKDKELWFLLEDLCFENYDSNRSAFVGRCGTGPNKALYLVSYSGIILAEDPRQTWDSLGCKVYVSRFVDIKIEVV